MSVNKFKGNQFYKMVDTIEVRSNTNALAKRLHAERFFKTSESSINADPTILIAQHEQWLAGELERHGLKIDDRTWSNFHDNAIERSLDNKVLKSTGRLERQTFQSVGNILQALAWYHCPEGASWKVPEINLQLNSPIFVDNERFTEAAKSGKRFNSNRWMGPMVKHKSDLAGFGGTCKDEAEFIFQVNEHYEGVRGSLTRKDGAKMSGIRCGYNCETNILTVSFSNPNDFMGWESKKDEDKWIEEDKDKLVYGLAYLNQFLADLVRVVSEQRTGAIAIETWRAY